MEYPKVEKELFNVDNENLQKLASLFPSAVKDGQLDIDALKEELGQFEEVGQEKYELNWAGKQNAKKEARKNVLGKTLRYIEGDGVNEDTTQNLYIEGDNLEVLKLLRKNYYGSIKMIYIDPPYNTGNDFLPYRDNFAVTQKEVEVLEGTRNELGQQLVRNTKDSSKFHTKWLNELYPVLKLAKDLLTEDGLICSSIDDNEMENLKMLMNEVFGEENTKVICVKMSEPTGLKMASVIKNGNIPKLKEYVILAKKNGINNLTIDKISKDKWDNEYKTYLENLTREDVNTIKEIRDNPERTPENLNTIDEILSKVTTKSISEMYSTLGITSEKEKMQFNYDNAWRIVQIVSMSGGAKIIADEKSKVCNNSFYHIATPKGEIYIIKNGYDSNMPNPRIKVLFADDYLTVHPGDFWQDIKTTGLDNEGGVDYKNGKKPLKLINRLVNMQVANEKEAIILDFYAGSSTTAESVMLQNKKDRGLRKFIMVQRADNLDEFYELANGDSKKDIKNQIEFLESINKPHLISEIGKERIRRAGKKIKEEIEQGNTQLKLGEEPKKLPDIGFKVFRVGETTLNWEKLRLQGKDIAHDYLPNTFDKDKLDFTPDFQNDLNVVYEIMLRQEGLALTSNIEKLTDIGSRTYLVADSYLITLEETITTEMIEKLSALNPLPFKFIFRDSAFDDDIVFKDETFRKLNALIDKNTNDGKKAYTVEFI